MMRDRQLLPINVSATDGVVMYETNFGFHRQPFQCADLTRAFFISESIRSILPQLLHALRSDLGIAVLTGPAGVGKTSLLKHLQMQLAHEGRAILCSGAGLETPTEVLQTLQAASLLKAGESSSESASSVAVRSRWTVVEQMRKTTEFWGPILLLVDDAQLLSVPVLNELRAFTEEEWNGRALVRCLIAGPLNLEEELARPAYADFSRRVRCHAFLEPLSSKESLECLNRHLSVVGGKLRDVFSPQALDLIAVASDGLPRCLTLLADESLVVAAERSTKVADEDCVRSALTRLQHLAYAWNTSPLVSDHQSSAAEPDPELRSTSANMKTSHTATTVTHVAAGIFEFGAPGVIEFGAKSSTDFSMSRPASMTVNPAEIAVSELSGNREPAAAPSLTTTQKLSLGVVEIGSTQAQSFEVGHRYQPDALEASDAVEMDAFASSSVENDEALFSHDTQELSYRDSFNEHMAEFDADAATRLLGLQTTSFEDQAQPGVDGQDSDFDSTSIEFQSTISSQHVHFMHNPADAIPSAESSPVSADAQEQMIRSAIGADLSSRLPVFDRYTWIALGREVPSGTYSVSSALDMQRVTDNEFGAHDEWLTKDSLQNALAFDRIPVSRTSDADIMMMLKSHQLEPDQGEFVTFRPAPLFGHGATETTELQNREIAAASFAPASTPFASVESRGQQNTPMVSDDDVISDANRQVIQDAIRSSLLASLAESASVMPAVDAYDVTDSFEVADSFATLNGPLNPVYPGITEQFQVNGWHDGQLIFNPASAEQTESAASLSAKEVAPEQERVSLNFEAARLARDGQSQPSREFAGAPHRESEPSAPIFFSLPGEVRTLEWDLRGDLLSTDDAGPLADTLASLRDEVTKFQKTGRITSPDDSQSTLPPDEFNSRKSDGSLENLVTTARNRLESFSHADVNSLEHVPLSAAIGTATDAAILTQPVSQTSGAERTVLPSESAVLPEATSSPADNRSPTGAAEPGDFSPRYSQLFTKLRQVRSRAAGNR